MEIILSIGLIAFIAWMLPTVVEMETVMNSGTGKLSVAQLKQLASNAGFSGGDLETAVAIALAESSGNPNAVGDLTLGTSVGLWQVNLRWHPEYTHQALLDPQTNANAAYAIWDAAGSDFSPWSTYKTGAYLSHLDQNGAVNA